MTQPEPRSVWMQDLSSDDVEDYLKTECTVIVPIGRTRDARPASADGHRHLRGN